MAKKTDEKTLGLIKEIQRRKAEIATLEKPNWRTNCSFSYGSQLIAINIHVSDTRTLILIAAFLSDKKKGYDAVAPTLGIESIPEFTWGGFSVDDWLSDIKTRIAKIQIVSKRQKLEQLETRLNAIVSPELRAAMELEAIESELA